jgi:ATP-binding cassette subfamily F protein uup
MLTKLGVYNFDQPVCELSGGQRKRLALVSVLLAPAEILVLDEPTNHLDQEMADWLEDVLRQRKEALVMVTHDRYFLDSVTERIIEIDKGHIYSYQGNYSEYLRLKMQREEQAFASEQKRQNILRKELAWIRRGAKARTTKQKGRIQRYEALRDQDAPVLERRVELESISTRMGKTTVELDHICKKYDDRELICDFSYIFLKHDRVGFVGPNGSGKTTLMKMIAGYLKPDSGTITIGQTIKIGYYSQELETEDKTSIAYMNPDDKVIDYIRNTAEYVRTRDGLVSAAKMLERFLFTSSMQYSRIEKLSGGERRRLNLLRVLMEAPNVLLLDEPTNDLDIATLNILEDYLDGFDGIVVVVSHDRYFLDRTVNRIFAFEENGQIRQYEGGYTDYAEKRQDSSGMAGKTEGKSELLEASDHFDSKTDSRATWKSGRKLKFTYQEQKDFESIEGEISDLEEHLEELDAQMLKFASDFVKLAEITKEKEETEEKLEERMQRWMYLEDLAEKIRNQ